MQERLAQAFSNSSALACGSVKRRLASTGARGSTFIETSAITPETGLAYACLDSLAVAELLFSIEERFGVDLGDVQPEQVPATLAELVRLIDGKAAA